jgi:hypothetical protein
VAGERRCLSQFLQVRRHTAKSWLETRHLMCKALVVVCNQTLQFFLSPSDLVTRENGLLWWCITCNRLTEKLCPSRHFRAHEASISPAPSIRLVTPGSPLFIPNPCLVSYYLFSYWPRKNCVGPSTRSKDGLENRSASLEASLLALGWKLH